MTDTITLKRDEAAQILNSLRDHPGNYKLNTEQAERNCAAMDLLQAALAAPQPEQELEFGEDMPEPQPVKQAPPYCGSSHCSCIECVMEPVKQALPKLSALKRDLERIAEEDQRIVQPVKQADHADLIWLLRQRNEDGSLCEITEAVQLAAADAIEGEKP